MPASPREEVPRPLRILFWRNAAHDIVILAGSRLPATLGPDEAFSPLGPSAYARRLLRIVKEKTVQPMDGTPPLSPGNCPGRFPTVPPASRRWPDGLSSCSSESLGGRRLDGAQGNERGSERGSESGSERPPSSAHAASRICGNPHNDEGAATADSRWTSPGICTETFVPGHSLLRPGHSHPGSEHSRSGSGPSRTGLEHLNGSRGWCAYSEICGKTHIPDRPKKRVLPYPIPCEPPVTHLPSHRPISANEFLNALVLDEVAEREAERECGAAHERGVSTEVASGLARLVIRLGLAAQLRTGRQRRGLTQVQLAAETGLQQGDISRFELAQAEPSLTTVARLGLALGTEFRLSTEF